LKATPSHYAALEIGETWNVLLLLNLIFNLTTNAQPTLENPPP
jgi:hypothetical protein